MTHLFTSFQQLAFKRIKRLLGSHEAAIKDYKEHEEKAIKQLDSVIKTCQGLMHYIDLLQIMQRIPKQ